MKMETLVTKWEEATNAILADGVYQIPVVEELLRETYRLCTEYKDENLIPKAFFKMFLHIKRFVDGLAVACCLDELTTPSDAAEYDGIAAILDAITYGFYTENYERAYPYICVDNNENKAYKLNVEEAFLDYFIDQNR